MKRAMFRGWTNHFAGTGMSVVLALLAIIPVRAALPTDTCRQATWVTNGTVRAIVPAGDKVYLVGDFTSGTVYGRRPAP